MIKKKICLIGSFGVGKTSLVSRFVKGIFSEKYLSTIGVMISQKPLQTSAGELLLVVWDLAGEDDFQGLRISFLKGASGLLFVADGTREESLRLTQQHIERARQFFSDIPAIVLRNKVDLSDRWEITSKHVEELSANIEVLTTSAKTGENVELAFSRLGQMIVGEHGETSETFL